MSLKPFEKFVERRRNPAFVEGNPPPEFWEGTPAEWEGMRQQAEDVEREKLAAEFADLVVKGFTFEEIVSGELERGSVVKTMTGQVVRPSPSTLPPEIEQEAARMLRHIAARRITLSPIQQDKMERIAQGRWDGIAEPVKAVMYEVQGIIESYDFRQQSERQEADAPPTLKVLWPFRGPGGRTYSPGEMKATPELVTELTEWAEGIETKAKTGTPLKQIGFKRWPVFEVLNGTPK